MIPLLAKTARLVASRAANTRYAALSALLQLLLHPAAARDCSQPGHCAQLSLQAANGGDVQRQLIFVHVAKTGGTSVLTWAGGNYVASTCCHASGFTASARSFALLRTEHASTGTVRAPSHTALATTGRNETPATSLA